MRKSSRRLIVEIAALIAERVQNSLEDSGALAGAAKLIVAVSGGCDSVALLHALSNLRGALAVNPHVASLDHGLRGEAGRADLDFVGELAAEWGLPHTLGQVDVPQLARAWGIGVEAAARRARYDFLAQVAHQEDSSAVIVGHHADDQAETVLMNIVRGSGLRGLGGMRLVSPLPWHPHLVLIRPLLSVSRAELEQYCQANNLRYRQDETNWDRRYRRNFTRHEIMDTLKRMNPDVVSALNRLAESAAADEDFVAGQLESLAQAAVHRRDDGCSISRPLFREAHPALQRRLLRRAFHQLAPAGESLTHELTLDLVAFCHSARSGSARDIGAALELRIDYDEIRLQRQGGPGPSGDYRLIPAATDAVLGVGETYETGGLLIEVCGQARDCPAGAALVLPAGCELRLRTRRAGDRFKPKGMGGRSRKLKDWMIDRKIPRRIRDQIPLLCADGAVVAIRLGSTWHLAHQDALTGGAASATVVRLA